MAIYNNFGMETEISVAAVRTGKQIADFAELGADIVTCVLDVYKVSFEHPFTTLGGYDDLIKLIRGYMITDPFKDR